MGHLGNAKVIEMTQLERNDKVSSRFTKNDMGKFYAVKAGRVPGLYLTWAECQEQVTGFPGNNFKSFNTKEEAELFLRGERVETASEPTKFYAVKAGRCPGIYTSWSECRAQVDAFPENCFKSFATKTEAEAYMKGEQPREAEVIDAPIQQSSTSSEPEPEPEAQPSPNQTIYVDGGQNKLTQKVAWGHVVDENGRDLLCSHLDLLEDMTLQTAPISGGTLVIVADFAGVNQQNNGAELMAMVAGLRIALETGASQLCSDSDLLVTYWSRGHCNDLGDSRKVALIKECASLRRKFEKAGGKIVKISGDRNPADLGFHKS